MSSALGPYQEFPKWLWDDQTADLRNGVGIVIDIASIEFKAMSYLASGVDAVSIKNDLEKGNNADATITALGFVAGESVAKFLSDLKFTEKLTNAVAIGTSYFTEAALQVDNYEKENE